MLAFHFPLRFLSIVGRKLTSSSSRISISQRYFNSTSCSFSKDGMGLETAEVVNPAPVMAMDSEDTDSGAKRAKMSFLSSPLTQEMRDEWRHNFFQDPKNIVALQACMKLDPLDVCLSRSRIEENNNVFTHKVSGNFIGYLQGASRNLSKVPKVNKLTR